MELYNKQTATDFTNTLNLSNTYLCLNFKVKRHEILLN